MDASMLSKEELEALHRRVFEQAKENIIESGRLMPCVFFIFNHERPLEAMEAAGLHVPPGTPNTAGPRMVITPTVFSSAELVEGLCRAEPRLKAPTALARESAPPFPHPDGRTVEDIILGSMLEAMKLTREDAVAMVLEFTARTLGAYALIKVDEAWVVTRSTMAEAVAVTPSEQADREEVVLATMETRTGTRALSARIIRDNPDDEESRIVQLVDRELQVAGGRYVGLVEQAN